MPDRELYDANRLFVEISEGSLRAFEILFNSYKSRIYALALKFCRTTDVAEEIVQEVFLSIWSGKARLKEVNNADGYLFTVAYNKIFSHLRSVSKNQRLVQQLIKNYHEGTNNTEEQVDLNQSLEIINQVIGELPEQRRLIFLLNREEGLSYKDIADRLSISPHTVRNQLAEAKKQIRHLLAGKGMLSLALLYFL